MLQITGRASNCSCPLCTLYHSLLPQSQLPSLALAPALAPAPHLHVCQAEDLYISLKASGNQLWVQSVHQDDGSDAVLSSSHTLQHKRDFLWHVTHNSRDGGCMHTHTCTDTHTYVQVNRNSLNN